MNDAFTIMCTITDENMSKDNWIAAPWRRKAKTVKVGVRKRADSIQRWYNQADDEEGGSPPLHQRGCCR